MSPLPRVKIVSIKMFTKCKSSYFISLAPTLSQHSNFCYWFYWIVKQRVSILDMTRRKELRNQWYKLSDGMMTALREAAMKCSELSDGQRMKWTISTTHDEVLNGLLNQEIDTTRGLCYIRNIKQFHKMETVDESYGKLVGVYDINYCLRAKYICLLYRLPTLATILK